MDVVTMLKGMTDPMGIPFYPIAFEVLGVLTFALHILLVNVSLGAVALAVYGRLKGGARWERLSGAMAKAGTAAVSGAIVVGVAPLLFVQVLYDPFWYASNVLSAAWVIGFVFVMMLGYGSLYVFYFGKTKSSSAWGVLSFSCFLLAGAIMHVLNYQMLLPERWAGWYEKLGGAVVSGTTLHAFSLPRFLHFIVPSFAVGGVFLLLYSWYFAARPDFDADYLGWTARLGARLAFWATAAEALVGVWWLVAIPKDLHFTSDPVFLLAAALGVVLLALLWRLSRDPRPQRLALHAAGGVFAVVLAMAAAREVLRRLYVGRFGYTVREHPVHLDLGSTALFLGTFVLGVSVLSWLLAVAFQSGRVAGAWEAGPRMRAWGKLSLGLLAAWIVLVAGFGVFVTLRNGGF
ncbi:MAG: hypothetical protein KGM24_15320 [Elusimicrobia bacterium]|nr:hypothetical protein [Elusimicrobiota bacterium]